jgi:AbrB family looped-hinge helix DNA binding protein
MRDPFITHVTSKRRTTVPKAIRDYLGIKPGMQVEWEGEGDHWRLYKVDPETDETIRERWAKVTVRRGNETK